MGQSLYLRALEGKLFWSLLQFVALASFGVALIGGPPQAEKTPFEENISSRINLRFTPHQLEFPKREAGIGKSNRGAESLTRSKGKQKEILERYLALVKRQIESKKRYPRREKLRRQEGTAHVRFVINRRGQIVSSRLTKPSIYKGFNLATLQSVDDSAPFPPFPQGLEQQSLTLEFRLDFRLH